MYKLVNAKVIMEECIKTGMCIVVENDRISYIGYDADRFMCESIDMKGNFLAPGFIDLHVHGGCGYSFMDCTCQEFAAIVKYYENCGITNLMPTALAASTESIKKFLSVYNQMYDDISIGRNLVGIHLEGPYINKDKSGAQNSSFCKSFNLNECKEFIDMSRHIKRMTVAPELDEEFKVAQFLKQEEIIVSAGHTDSMYDLMSEALNNGYDLVTHMYSSMNGMSIIDGFRCAGAIEAILLNNDVYVELIADGRHLPAPIIELVYKIKGREKIAIVSDAMRATGTKVKESYLGEKKTENRVIVEDGVAKNINKKCLAGSITAINQMILFLYKNTTIPLKDIIYMVTATPAKILNKDSNLGLLGVGKIANLVSFNENVEIMFVMNHGEIVKNGL